MRAATYTQSGQSEHDGFTLIELLVVISVIAILMSIILPALTGITDGAKKIQNGNNLNSIHQALAVYAQGNKDRYPGLGLSGSQTHTTAGRLQILLEERYLTSADAVISPAEDKTPWRRGTLSNKQYSYALLQIDANATGRRSEWGKTVNAMSIVATDRNTGTDATDHAFSYWSRIPGRWEGNVVWNDNHVTFQKSHRDGIHTWYGQGPTIENDNLFAEETGTGQTGNNALMIYD